MQVNYLIGSIGRSGSSLLCEALWRSGVAGHPIEPKTQPEIDVVLKNRTSNGVGGVKLLWYLCRGLDFQPYEFKFIIHTFRNDKLAQAVSHSKAEQTRQWVSCTTQHGTPIYDRQSIELHLARIAKEEGIWAQVALDMGVPCLRLAYEDISIDPDGAARTVIQFMGMTPPDTFMLKPARLKKQADEINANWIARYNEGL